MCNAYMACLNLFVTNIDIVCYCRTPIAPYATVAGVEEIVTYYVVNPVKSYFVQCA